MRDNVRRFVQLAAESLNLRGPVYEFGAYQVDGQNGLGDLRGCFPGQRFTGCDFRAGPGVDRIEDLAQLTLPDCCAGTVVCVDTLEHVFEARRAVDEMIRILAPGGTLLLAAPMDFRIHDYPGDYWRITPSCMARLLSPLPATLIGSQGVENYPHTVFGLAQKAPVARDFAGGATRLLARMQQALLLEQTSQPWLRQIKQRCLGLLRGKGERRRIEQFFETRFAVCCTPLGGRAEAMLAPAAADQEVGMGSRIDWQSP